MYNAVPINKKRLRSEGGSRISKKTGVVVRNFEQKKTLRDTKILFCGCGLNFFHPYLRDISSKETHYLLSYFFRFNILKRIAKPPVVDLARLNTRRGTLHTAGAREI